MKYALQLYSLRNDAERLGADGLLRMVKDAGFDGVEFAGFYGMQPQEIAELMNKYGLQASSAHVSAQEVSGALPYLIALGVKRVYIPWVSESDFEGEAYHDLKCRISEAIPVLKRAGIGLGYHNHAHEFSRGTDFVAKLTDAVPGLGIELDVFWAHVAGLDPVAAMRRYRGKLSCIHVKEAAPIDPVNSPQPVVGQGAIDMRAVFEEAKAQGIEWAVLEAESFEGTAAQYLAASCNAMRRLGGEK